MEHPGKPHVRVWEDSVYIERVPNAWVFVADNRHFKRLNDQDREYLIARALKIEQDGPLPPA